MIIRPMAIDKRLATAILTLIPCLWSCIGCGSGEKTTDQPDSGPRIMATADNVQFVRTPDACFEDLPGFP